MSRPANVATGKCRDRQMSRPANVATGKCRDRQMSRPAEFSNVAIQMPPANVATGKCRDRQKSDRQKSDRRGFGMFCSSTKSFKTGLSVVLFLARNLKRKVIKRSRNLTNHVQVHFPVSGRRAFKVNPAPVSTSVVGSYPVQRQYRRLRPSVELGQRILAAIGWVFGPDLAISIRYFISKIKAAKKTISPFVVRITSKPFAQTQRLSKKRGVMIVKLSCPYHRKQARQSCSHWHKTSFFSSRCLSYPISTDYTLSLQLKQPIT